jgi:hypothetical protein
MKIAPPGRGGVSPPQVSVSSPKAKRPVWRSCRVPSDYDIAHLLQQVHHRVLRLLHRRGHAAWPAQSSPTLPPQAAQQLKSARGGPPVHRGVRIPPPDGATSGSYLPSCAGEGARPREREEKGDAPRGERNSMADPRQAERRYAEGTRQTRERYLLTCRFRGGSILRYAARRRCAPSKVGATSAMNRCISSLTWACGFRPTLK